ncbi:MAG: DUF4417 domain-containing protein [Bacilli bacterium]|nr:DUF4417 domain-containing protein [Bacilli bacterium]MDD3422356.1 DUF4417 domain-containing protein [Bacilli bacterium]MDD4066132.1 DUF4417 domain-containing protein [Bacilli bacterium]
MDEKNNKKVKDNYQAFLTNGACFTKNEEYPIIEDWMIPKEPPKRIIPFDKLSLYTCKEISESYICFYCADVAFAKIIRNPKHYLKMFRRCKGLIGFDYSVFRDMPHWKQKELMGKNLSLDFYYGFQHYPIIPNIRWGSEDLVDEYLAAIPQHTLIAVGTYGFIKTNEEKTTWMEFLKSVCNKLHPSGIIVYGSAPESVFNICVQQGIPIYQYESFQSKRMKEVHKDGYRNKRV